MNNTKRKIFLTGLLTTICLLSFSSCAYSVSEKSSSYGFVFIDTPIRTGKGDDYSIIGIAHESERFEYISVENQSDKSQLWIKNNNEAPRYNYWYKVVVDNNEGWIDGSFFFPQATMINDEKIAYYKSIKEISEDSVFESSRHGDYYFYKIAHHNSACEGYCDVVDIWLQNMLNGERIHLLKQQEYSCGNTHWSSNNKYFLYYSEGAYIYDVENMKTDKIEQVIESPYWTRNNTLIYLSQPKWSKLIEYDPSKKMKRIFVDFGDYSRLIPEKCDEGGDPPCYLHSAIYVDNQHLSIGLYSKNAEYWVFSFDDSGNVLKRKLINSCKDYNF